jgi:hypothetical protein
VRHRVPSHFNWTLRDNGHKPTITTKFGGLRGVAVKKGNKGNKTTQ